MPRKKKQLSLAQKLEKISAAGLKIKQNFATGINSETELDTVEKIEVRLKKLLGISETHQTFSGNMLFFIMYDIASNKVRREVSNYLIKKGCSRVQRSIFLADLPPALFKEIKETLVEVQSYYDNEDSILIVPISTDLLKSMKVIGQSIDFDLITHNKNTLFF